ncbi:hypothetical protein SASPL_100579 [Salvia splendens]|uniref:Alpha/beta hydrolase fold-3 domain-containing protein n=1 Tax=Salvia splendens TaxID=180675 RepID=A0A8X9ADA9_SALSN|nr:hypothetical protein SASPL_100579 [Salvia splendens]
MAGTILNQPFFGGKQLTKSELEQAVDDNLPLPEQDLLWQLALPVGTDMDHRFSNPLVAKENVKNIGRCLVIGFGGDPLIDRQQDLVKMLVDEGVAPLRRKISASVPDFDDGGFHGVDMVESSKRATAVLNYIKTFV